MIFSVASNEWGSFKRSQTICCENKNDFKQICYDFFRVGKSKKSNEGIWFIPTKEKS